MGAEAPSEVVEVSRLRDLRASDQPVAILGRIVSVVRREVVRRTDGGRRPVLTGLLSDGSATVRFTWWDPPAEEVERGTVIRAAPVAVREFRGLPELSFGWRTRVAPASASELPVLGADELPSRQVSELAGGLEGFRLTARVVEVSPKAVTVANERRQIHQGLLADRSGLVAFTAWSDFRLRPGEAVRLTGGYVRNFRGRPQLVLDERTLIERLETSDLPENLAGGAGLPVRLGVLAERPPMERATVEGRALALQPPSGLVHRCPNCSRLLKGGLCRLHGPVAGAPDLKLRLVVDDGTGVITLTLDRGQTEQLTGRTLDECLSLVRERGDPALVENELLKAVVGRRLRARGPTSKDDFGLSMFPVEVGGAPEAEPTRRAELGRRLAGGAG